jgi:hypothetical protein
LQEDIPVKEVLLTLSILVVSYSILISGCASKSTTESPEITPSHSKLYKEKQEEFADRNPIIISNIGELKLTIRMATQADMPEEYYKTWLGFIGLGAGSAGVLATPVGLYAPAYITPPGALVLGGLIVIPGTLFYSYDKAIWTTISTSISQIKLTHIIGIALNNKLNNAFSNESSAPNLDIELVILAIGIISTPQAPCFVLSADFIVRQSNIEILRDQLNITETNRSKDAPPPQCASLSHFAENEGRLVTETSNEYAEVLAVMATERILRGIVK